MKLVKLIVYFYYMCYPLSYYWGFVPSIVLKKSNWGVSLQGIKGFRTWLLDNIPEAVTEINNNLDTHEFDHVLVDMNQLLHKSLRKASNEDHGLIILLKELDKCLQLASPRRSLVLAFDGPPSAAKLATQRQRRRGIITRMNRTRGALEMHKRKKRLSCLKEVASLSITPGTLFMDKARDAMLFWAWQRMSGRTSTLRRSSNVKIYISSSETPGEGEVKLLDYIYRSRHTKKHASIAFLGGDSDLVLEALILPPKISYNVFVISPDTSRKSFSVSTWEVTRQLVLALGLKEDFKYIGHLRRDIVLLFILNGNDYLPKLRSSGFEKLLSVYLKLLKLWMTCRKNDTPFLLTPSLSFNVPFTLAFFRDLAKVSSTHSLYEPESEQLFSHYEKSETPLSVLYTALDAGYLPKPIEWTLSSHQFLTLTLGLSNNTSPDSKYYSFQRCHQPLSKLKSTKHQLASIVLKKILDIDWQNPPSYLSSINQRYSWEVDRPVECDVQRYLYGLLWNLQTYRDGVCTDYAYNYGKRIAPSSVQIVTFLKNYKNNSLDKNDLHWGRQPNATFTHALSDGLSAIAALPSEVKHLIPQPFSVIVRNSTFIESLYGECMDPYDNFFHLDLFRKKCLQTLKKEEPKKATNVTKSRHKQYEGKKILTSSKYWTVLSHSSKPLVRPFAPPKLFTDGISKLRQNKFIKVGRLLVTSEPSSSLYSTDFSYLLHSIQDDRPYLKAYANVPNMRMKQLPNKKINKLTTVMQEKKKILPFLLDDSDDHITSLTTTSISKLQPNQQPQNTYQIEHNAEGLSPLANLNCLIDAKCFTGTLHFDVIKPQHNCYENEIIRLSINEKYFEGGCLTFEISRNKNHGTSKKIIKQQLASFALTHLFGLNWMDLSLKEMKLKLLVRV